MDRLNPVTLISGAASGLSAITVREIAHRSTGGLLLADADEDALAALADDLEAHNAAPERMSTLALDVQDQARWAQAIDFIRSQYGRLDWAVILGAGPSRHASDLVQFGRPKLGEIEGAATAIAAVATLIRSSTSGGAIVIGAHAAALDEDLPAHVASAAAEAAFDLIKVNAIAPSGEDAARWRTAPHLSQLIAETGSEQAALVRIAALSPRVARVDKDEDTARLILLLLADDAPLTGATLIMDGALTL